MIRHAFVMGLVLAAALPAQAADRLSYSYLDATYVGGELEPATGEAENVRQGFRLGASGGLANWLNFVGEYEETRYDPTPSDSAGTPNGDDYERAFSSVGLGVHSAKRAYQLQLAATYERLDFDFRTPVSPFRNQDEKVEGYGVTLGVRVPLPSFELHASYKYFDYDDEDAAGVGAIGDGGRARAGFLMQLTPFFALTADYQQTSFDEVDYNLWSAGFRRYFGTAVDRARRTGGVLAGLGDDSGPAE